MWVKCRRSCSPGLHVLASLSEVRRAPFLLEPIRPDAGSPRAAPQTSRRSLNAMLALATAGAWLTARPHYNFTDVIIRSPPAPCRWHMR